MIHTIRTVAVGDQESKIDSPIILYRGDREVEVEFTINGSKFTFTNGGNVIKSTNATHGQLVINTPTGENMFSGVTECHDGKVVFVITKEMIDELIEVGFYSFQIRLFDESQVSRVTIPPVLKGIDIRNPIAAEDETNVVDIGLVDYAVIVKDEFEDLSTFLPDGNYNKTEWESKDVISGAKLNKIEDALYNINSNMEATDFALLNSVENINKNVYGEIEKLGDELESEIEQLKIDTNAAMTTNKNEVSNELESLNSQLTHIENDINRRSINVTNLFTEELNEDNTSLQFYNAFKYCVDNGYMAYIPRGTYVVNKINTSIDNAAALVIPNGANVVFENGVTFKLKADSPSWTRTVVLHGDNKLYGHFEIDGSADTITNGNEHMAGLYSYGRRNIYIESLYSYNCYGDNVQITGADIQGENIIIDRLRCRKAGRKNLVFENSTNIHIKNAYLDNTEGTAGVWTGGGCLDIEPLSKNNSCCYRIDRLETTGTNDFTIGTDYENAAKFILDIGTLVQHSGELFSYSFTINIGTAVFYNCKIYQMYGSLINIDNATFINQSRRIIDSYFNKGVSPILSIKNLNVSGDTTVEHEGNLIFSQGGNIYIGNAWINGYNNTFIGTNTTKNSTISLDNVHLNNVGEPGNDITYLSTYGEAKLCFNIGNIMVNDDREVLPKCLFDIATLNANDGMNIKNILNDTGIQTSRSHYGNFTPTLTNGGPTERRPTKPGHAEQYYDTTLKKPIWWNGTNWTDATGAEV